MPSTERQENPTDDGTQQRGMSAAPEGNCARHRVGPSGTKSPGMPSDQAPRETHFLAAFLRRAFVFGAAGAAAAGAAAGAAAFFFDAFFFAAMICSPYQLIE